MILDQLEHAAHYNRMGERIAAALDYLVKGDYPTEPGRYDLDGDNLYVMLQQFDEPAEIGKFWESHLKYIDIHYVLEGTERMGWAYKDRLTVTQAYDEEKDYMLFSGDGTFFEMKPGQFAIMFPQDAHMGALLGSTRQPIRKLVFKIRVDA